MRKGRTGTETRLPTVEMVPTDGDDKGTLEGFNQSRTGLKTRTLFDVLHAFSSPFVVFFESHSTVCLRKPFRDLVRGLKILSKYTMIFA